MNSNSNSTLFDNNQYLSPNQFTMIFIQLSAMVSVVTVVPVRLTIFSRLLFNIISLKYSGLLPPQSMEET